MKTHDEKVAEAQELIFKAVKRSLDKHGTQATLEALAIQFGVAGAAAVICDAVLAPEFMGRYVLRAIAVCDTACKEDHVYGVVQ